MGMSAPVLALAMHVCKFSPAQEGHVGIAGTSSLARSVWHLLALLAVPVHYLHVFGLMVVSQLVWDHSMHGHAVACLHG